jgi:bacillolysin
MYRSGITYLPFSLDVDVVAHEIMHGVTQYTSDLIYNGESGALNEAMSDIFGACVDRQEGASIEDTWLVGENIYTPGVDGDGIRHMNNPTLTGSNDADYYPEKYRGWDDEGGVHWNSGIANLAFSLMVSGG